MIPFAAKRKASGYDQNVNRSAQAVVSGTFHQLYARIDRVASPGTLAHEFYSSAVKEILGVFIGTQSAVNGKQAGYYYDEDTFVPLDQMGDGVSEIVALIVDLSLANGKVFVLEEPETNLHPKGLKALLNLVRESASKNQFIIATHSNIVLRELGTDPTSRVFRVHKQGDQSDSPSSVIKVERGHQENLELLRELGYEFGDFDLHDGWLFLEESSAEFVVREILIPWFTPKLRGRLRTFSAAGVDNLEPS
ncbi:AAA family ATPase, partial [Phenylobacterium sp.]|uniref:AAA family ATPase n=1 Tax=Phenylobacterium sp. TaxID=1871053 RepID=UPI00286B8487